MLSQLTFSNYKSFKDEVTLDFTPENINEHKESLITDKQDNEQFLPVIVLYGPNGGGKSTVLEALSTVCNIILCKVVLTAESINNLNKNILSEILTSIDLTDKYHKFDRRCSGLPCSFDILFRTQLSEYKYQLNIIQNEIVEENLYMRKITDENVQIVFERDSEDCYLSEKLNSVTAGKINKTMPLLSYIAINYNIDVIDDVINWFKNIRYIDYNKPFLDKGTMIPEDKKLKKMFFGMLRELDINIADVRLEKDSDGHIINIFMKHILRDGTTAEIKLEDESSGTRKLFGLLPRLIEDIYYGRIIIADEMDAKLHPKLLKYIIELFKNPNINKRGAQLLFTSHDMTTMVPELFRRDEIWFCAINADNSSYLYPLISFKKSNGTKIRNDEKYNKRYLEGRYGADPYLRKILNWEDIEG